MNAPLRVVQWTTGNVARATVRAVMRRPDLELVGCHAWSPEKVGVDVATLCRLEDSGPTGIVATDDVEALLALRPDCIIYTPLHFDDDLVERLLRSGANVVTTAEFVTGASMPGSRERLQTAALAGGASLLGTGMNPGFAQLLAVVATGLCAEVRHVRSIESVDVSAFASDSNQDDLGWGRELGDPTHADDVRRAVAVFEDGLDLLAGCLAIELDATECRVEFAAAVRDLDLPGRPIATGTVAGIDIRFVGIVGGRDVLEVHQRWVMDAELEPPMPVQHGYRIEVDGSPQISLDLGILPDQPLETLTVEDMHGIGMTITGSPAVNAVRHVVAAAPGVLSYADIPAPGAAVVGRARPFKTEHCIV